MIDPTNKNLKPPRIGVWLLESFCSYDFLSTALWDLEELYQDHVATKGVFKAKLLYYREVFSIIFHLFSKGRSQFAFNGISMFKINLTLAIRNLRRHMSYSLLNVVGLSSGMLIFLLITNYTSYEFSYDLHHEKVDRIYRVTISINTFEDPYLDSGTPAPLAESMLAEFAEVAATARFITYRNQLLSANNKRFKEQAIFVADPGVFQIFTLHPVSGNLDNFSAAGPNIAISESFARKYFGHTDVANETMLFNGSVPLRITAVYEDMPPNSHFVMDIIVNFEWVMKTYNEDLTKWNNNPFYTYVLLNEANDAQALTDKLPALRAKYADDPMDEDGQTTTYFLEPMREVHFSQEIGGGMGDAVDAGRLYTFTAIALVVLLMAGINYVNLATARASVRMKETGIKKIMGARRNGLLSQFLVESGVLVFISLALAFIIAYLALPAFSLFVERPLAFAFGDPIFMLKILGFGLLLTLLSGIYPAAVMSSFKPLDAIANKVGRYSTQYVRNGLIILQFSLSTILILAALVLQEQLSFIDSKDTGYTRKQVILLSTMDDAIDDRLATYMESIQNISGVAAVATSWSLPTNVTSNTQANWPGIADAERIQMYLLGVTHDFFDLYEIAVVEGRTFDANNSADQSAILLNEAAVHAFGWEDPIGREMITQTGETGTVIGVVKDFHLKSLREEIEPLQIILNPNYARLAVRINGDIPATMAEIEKIYQSFEPVYPFEYRYFEDVYNAAYADDQKTSQLTIVFTILAIIIACLGLYGLATHKLTLRIKELGIRKVMGASTFTIAQLLFREFLVLIGIAFLIAGPFAYILMNGWLEGFAYHIDLDLSFFVITLVLLLGAALLTVGYRTMKASITSPAESLRDE